MKDFGLRSTWIFSLIAVLGICLAYSGCGLKHHPDDRLAVYNSLDQHDLRSITVSQDRDAGTITLSGIVGADDRKHAAEQLALQAAPGYTIVNRIQVDNAGLQGEEQNAQKNAQLDSAIEDHFRATLAAHSALKGENIQYSAYNGTLTLKGSVKSYKERQQAEDLAKKIPQVQNVVNQIQIAGAKPSPSHS
ncbi:MAG TPA: BON domain-containing protein [Terracidiphilus sp.]|jgi:hyperosmotically inducible protein